jgi:hypothetical protein
MKTTIDKYNYLRMGLVSLRGDALKGFGLDGVVADDLSRSPVNGLV